MPFAIPRLNLDIPYVSIKGLFITPILAFVAVLVYHLLRRLVRVKLSRARMVPGPSGGHFFLGHLVYVRDSEKGGWHEEIIEKYGHVVKYRTILGDERLFTVDAKALQHILSNSMIYQKESQARYIMGRLFGEGLVLVEGTEHKRQRRIINPSFSPGHIRELTDIFLAKSQELRDVLLAAATDTKTATLARVNVLSYLSYATLDIIGLAGFNYEFNTLSGQTAELSESFQAILSSVAGLPLVTILKAHIPVFRYVLGQDRMSRSIEESRKKMDGIGRLLVEKKKADIVAEKAAGGDGAKAARDLLTLMIESNMNEAGGGLTDREVLDQIPTFLLAGHETTSTSTTWALFSLATHPDIQNRLRSELLAVPTDAPSMSELDSLSYLDAVVRESLRYHSVVDGAIRVATKDDIIPLEKPFVGKDGKTRDVLAVSKGDSFFIPITLMNNAESIWGPDAKEFKWLGSGPPKETQGIPSVWGNQLTFLAGPRSCIGFKFALIEMKALLFTLLRACEFELAVPKEEILRKVSIVTRPLVKSEMEKGNQMPMFIRRVSHKT